MLTYNYLYNNHWMLTSVKIIKWLHEEHTEEAQRMAQFKKEKPWSTVIDESVV